MTDLVASTVEGLEPLVRASAVARADVLVDVEAEVRQSMEQMRQALHAQLHDPAITLDELEPARIASDFRTTHEVLYAAHDPAGRTAEEILADAQEQRAEEFELIEGE
ncbi:hypothetical protein ACTD5D_41330 [Nocardia takedensis]|uniref:hypothetical protein n=1 Tax=Nocardia takedensis TaxID=259390 RepID=UPI003F762E04